MHLPLLSHLLSGLALVAALGVTLWLWVRQRDIPRGVAPGRLLAMAAGFALWCGALYAFGSGSLQAFALEGLRDLGILWWLSGAFWAAPRPPMTAPLRLIWRLLILISLVTLLTGLGAHMRGVSIDHVPLMFALNIGAMIVAAAGLIIVDAGVRQLGAVGRVPAAAAAGGIAMLWAYELNVQLIGALTGQAPTTLIALVPAVVVGVLPTFVIAAVEAGRRRIGLSRPAAIRAILLLGAACYLILIGLVAALSRAFGGDYVGLAQAAFLCFAIGAGGLLLFSARARAWLSVVITKHFFEHRYDYRAEWMRFTATLAQEARDREGEKGDDAEEAAGEETSLHRRVAKALAELTGSPGALLMLPDTLGGFRIADHWRWPVHVVEEAAISLRSAFMLQESRHIVDLDARREGRAPVQAELADLAIPDWLVADQRAWVVVPILHFKRMIAIVVLQRPSVPRALDWEDLDVLRIAGQQAASYLAEAQSERALSEARRFDEFNRRFAFIMHDIKNLASQLSLLARNAERHADNPEFRSDMVGTLKLSAGRLSDLLGRLSSRERSPVAEARRVGIEPMLDRIADEQAARRQIYTGCQTGLAAWADAGSLHQILVHLVSNAIEASPEDAPVQILAMAEQQRVRIDIIDQGVGMTRQFIRDELFKPFVSTKNGGFGLGAPEALQLAQAMNGTIEVASEPGRGSCFTVWLPIADAAREPGGLTDETQFSVTPSDKKAGSL
ncbi:XrtA/PEP-CTERM system histidine kinase PrsK [Sphingopyxis sp. MWB1]|uniref:XrtA/PEP-CTERM system histidine kinase PrsK n=1 Tax=Sphingopyxis sp. MWB1 TaxID=1537715 RepID=UPI000AEBBDE8|nr:XrtA/PEP-CTERM system histidine kinase PrsK [Sphingopyxis sp. MWB1]